MPITDNVIRRLMERAHFTIENGALLHGGSAVYVKTIPCQGGTRRHARLEGHSMPYARLLCWVAHGPPPSDDHVADHIDRNQMNDAPENLRWLQSGHNLRRHAERLTKAEVRERAKNLFLHKMNQAAEMIIAHSEHYAKEPSDKHLDNVAIFSERYTECLSEYIESIHANMDHP